MHPNFATRLNNLLTSAVLQCRFSGVVLVRQGEVDLYRRAFGMANRTWGIKNLPETRFRIASVGKLFTAAAVMQLVEQGAISLDSRIVEILELDKDYPTHTFSPEITVRHLLSMTSGIADYIDEDAEDFDAVWAEFCRKNPLYLLRENRDYLPIFVNLPPLQSPAESFKYCNAGFILLGLMIEKVNGIPYFDTIANYIFQPAGMTASSFTALDDCEANVAEGYIPIHDRYGQVTRWKKNIYATTAGGAGDGGSTNTPDDMVRFIHALLEGRLCSADYVSMMLTAQVPERQELLRGYHSMYGFGCYLLLDDNGQVVRWGHTGEEDGVSCRLYHYPILDVDVIVLGNQGGCAGSISWDIHDLLMG